MSDEFELVRRATERSRRGAVVVAGLGPGLALIGLLIGNRPALLGLSAAGAVCVLIGVLLFRRATHTAQALITVLHDRPAAIATIATISIRHRTNTGIPHSREHTVGVQLDDGTRFALRSLTAEEQTEIQHLLQRLAPHARHVTGGI